MKTPQPTTPYPPVYCTLYSIIYLTPSHPLFLSHYILLYHILLYYYYSASAYEKATELEPSNPEHAKGLEKARKKLAGGSAATTRPPAAGGGGGGMPDLSALAGMMGGAGGPGGGDMGGLGAMLNNPGLMSAAQEMMKNPSMMVSLHFPSLSHMISFAVPIMMMNILTQVPLSILGYCNYPIQLISPGQSSGNDEGSKCYGQSNGYDGWWRRRYAWYAPWRQWRR